MNNAIKKLSNLALLLIAVGVVAPVWAQSQRPATNDSNPFPQDRGSNFTRDYRPVPQHTGTKFTRSNVLPYLNDLQRMLRSLQAVQTVAQAQQFQSAITQEAAALGNRAVTYNQALSHAAFMVVNGGATQESSDAEALTMQVSQIGQQVGEQMIRVGKLHPPLKPIFKQYRDLQQ
jgi:hypothetical protein